MPIVADLAQTFYLDSDAVRGSQYYFIHSIELFFKSKPTKGNTSTNLPKPGCTVYICDTKNVNNIGVPDLDVQMRYGRERKNYDDVNVSDSGLVGTTFTFAVPVAVKTNKAYAIVVKFDGGDIGYSLWRNKAGETYNSKQSPTITKGALDGYFFVLTNGIVPTPQNDQDLKFKLNICKFNRANTTFNFVNRNFELLRYDGDSLTNPAGFIGGEYVYANTGVPSGQTVSLSATSKTVTGNNTTFQTNFVNGSLIVLTSNTEVNVRKITSISNNTTLTLDYEPSISNTNAGYLVTAIAKVYDNAKYSNTINLVASTSNVSHNFLANSTCNTIIGVASNTRATITEVLDFNVDEFEARFGYFIPPGTAVDTYARLANDSYSTISTDVKIDMGRKRRFVNYPARLFSKTDEVMLGNGSIGVLENEKSMNFYAVFSTDNDYVTPYVDEEDLIFNAYKKKINSNTTNEHTLGGGAALAKIPSKRITLADGQDAEDIRVYVTAFRPYGTDVKVYAKFYNELDPESFDSKDWTLLEFTTPFNLYSNPNNYDNMIELEYKLPAYPIANVETLSAGTLLDGFFTGANGSTILTGTAINVNTYVSNNDLVRVYNPLFPNNSLVAVVTGSNTTTLSIDTTLLNANTRLAEFVTSGLKVERVTYKNQAFNNYLANNVIRYYNSQMAAFDTYKTFAFKIVLTGDEGSSVYPCVDDIRGIAVSV